MATASVDPLQKEFESMLKRISDNYENTRKQVDEKLKNPDLKLDEVDQKDEPITTHGDPPELTQSIVGAVLAFYTVAKTRIVQNSDEEDERKAAGQSYITKAQFKELVKATNAYRKVVDGLDEVLQNTWVKSLDDILEFDKDKDKFSSDPEIKACQESFDSCSSADPKNVQCDITYLECLEALFEEKLEDDIEAIEEEESEES